jgi:phage terminase small subunit
MTPDQFDRFANKTRLKERARGMARSVLVDGLTATEAARKARLSRESARASAARVMREVRAEGGYPREWSAVTVVVPPDAAEEIKAIAKRAHRAAGLLVD